MAGHLNAPEGAGLLSGSGQLALTRPIQFGAPLLCSGLAVWVLGVLLTLRIQEEPRAPLLLAVVGSPPVPPRSVCENPIVETPEMEVDWKIKII